MTDEELRQRIYREIKIHEREITTSMLINIAIAKTKKAMAEEILKEIDKKFPNKTLEHMPIDEGEKNRMKQVIFLVKDIVRKTLETK